MATRGEIVPGFYLWSGDPTDVSTSEINPGLGNLVVDLTTPSVYQKTSARGDNSGYQKLAAGSVGNVVVDPTTKVLTFPTASDFITANGIAGLEKNNTFTGTNNLSNTAIISGPQDGLILLVTDNHFASLNFTFAEGNVPGFNYARVFAPVNASLQFGANGTPLLTFEGNGAIIVNGGLPASDPGTPGQLYQTAGSVFISL